MMFCQQACDPAYVVMMAQLAEVLLTNAPRILNGTAKEPLLPEELRRSLVAVADRMATTGCAIHRMTADLIIWGLSAPSHIDHPTGSGPAAQPPDVTTGAAG